MERTNLRSETPVAKNQNKRAANSRVSQNKSPISKNPNPPQFKPTVVSQQRVRYVINAAGGVSARGISNIALQDTLCMATAAAVAYRLLDGIRIREIEVWAANGAGNASNSIVVEFLKTPGVGGPGWQFSDTALGLSDVAHVRCRPPKGSLAEDWLPSDTNSLIELTLPQGAVIDIIFDQVFADTDVPVLVTGAVAAATVGKVYRRALDNTNGVPAILPVGFDSI
jgi:hypothetical protein